MKKLRLLLFSDCTKSCPGCCNKDWNLISLPTCKTYCGFDEIILTGGEPMMNVSLVKETILEIRKQNSKAKIYMYTANVSVYDIYELFILLDGITVTLHDKSDIQPFIHFVNKISKSPYKELKKSLRLNVFQGVYLFENLDSGENFDLKRCEIKDNIKWIKHCPLPKDEVFMRLEIK
jgi:hypothetical protein